MNRKVSKPLKKNLGVGQGMIRSSDHYKIYINPVLETLDRANLGVNIGPINAGISCVADDLYLLSDDQTKLQGLIDICQHYGQSYRITYGANKTVISVVGSATDMQYYEQIQPWRMDNLTVSVKENNDHLGLIVSGNKEEEKNVDLKVKKARGALFKLLGPAFSAKCLISPRVQIHLFRTYICPIARCGLAAMALRTNQISPLTAFHRKVMRGFLHLSDSAPVPALYFLTGEIPIEARIHRDIFSLFYNILNNPQSKIFSIVKYLLENSPVSSHTWSVHIKNLAKMYNIESPLEMMSKELPKKEAFKNNITTKIIVFHEKQLRLRASTNSKMSYLNIATKGLNGLPHPALFDIQTTSSVQKMRPHIKMLCGDYYTYQLKAKYQGGSPHCRLCPNQDIEHIEHILTQCPEYEDVRQRIFNDIKNICDQSRSSICFEELVTEPKTLTQFILDCSSLNLQYRINSSDEHCASIFNLARDLCYSINKSILQKLRKLKV